MESIDLILTLTRDNVSLRDVEIEQPGEFDG